MQALRDHQMILMDTLPFDMYDREDCMDSTEWLLDPASEWVFRAVGLDQRRIWSIMDEPGLIERVTREVRNRKRRVLRDEV